MVNRLQNYATEKNNALRNKIDSIDDIGFLKSTGDTSKPANNKVILDDIEAVQKHNAIVDQAGAPQTNFAPFGNLQASESSTTPNATAEAPNRKNPLFDFEPVNYVITLSAITKEAFNSGGDEGEEIIIAKSGGKGAQGQGALGADYYIDNLLLINTVSPTSFAKSGITYNITFDITEPYGTSFIDALITATKQLGFENHYKTPYKLNIDFKGVDDDGNPSSTPIEMSSRTIPIQIYDVQMRVESGVTTYQCVGRPTTLLGTTILHGVTQQTLTVRGETVGLVLQDFFDQHSAVLQGLADKGIIVEPDIYTFSLEESAAEIINAKIPYDVNSSRQNVVTVKNTEANIKGNTFSQRTITVPAGTAMQAFIEAIVRESDFYRNQFDEKGEPLSNTDTLTAMRTMPRLNILSETGGGGGNRPLYEFIWTVRPFIVSSNYFKKEAEDLASNVLPVREYNYLYTGKNQDVLDFDITYKFAYYQAKTYFEKGGKDDPQTGAFSGNGPDDTQEENTTGTTGSGHSQATTEPVRQYKEGYVADLNTTNGEVATIFEQIIQDPSVDLITATLEIIGDPLWIEQKSVKNQSFINSFVDGSPCIDSNGAVTTDEYEVYIRMNFKTPTDLDDETGLFKIEDAAFFQGIYKVFTCESRFSGGVFTNLLSMVRMRHQQEDQSREQDNGDTLINNESKGVYSSGGAYASGGVVPVNATKGVYSSGGAYASGVSTPVVPESAGLNQFEQNRTSNNVFFLRNKLNATQQNSFDNLMSSTAQRDPLTPQGAYDYVLNNNTGVYVDPRKRLEERYGRLSPGALGGRQ